MVALHNDSSSHSNLTGFYNIKKGDRIAQLIIQPYLFVDFVEVDELNDTERGDGGFGHSGKN